MTTVLLTGAAGFVGSHCVEHWLAATDWNIIAVDSFQHRGLAARLPKQNSRLQVISMDLSLSAKKLACHNFDIVVNAASISHVDTSIESPGDVWRNNTGLMINMMELCRQMKPKLVVQTSTDEIYGPVLGGVDCGFREWDAVIPSNPYSASKAAQEALAVSYWRTYGVPVVLTNCVNMFGERQDTEKFLPKTIKALLEDKPIQIHADKNGSIGSRWWTHAKNYADLIVWLSKRKVASYARGADRPDRWHVCGQECIDNLEIACRVATILGKQLKFELIDAETARPGHDKHYGLDGSKVARAGWKYKFKLKESLESTVKWYAENRNWL